SDRPNEVCATALSPPASTPAALAAPRRPAEQRGSVCADVVGALNRRVSAVLGDSAVQSHLDIVHKHIRGADVDGAQLLRVCNTSVPLPDRSDEATLSLRALLARVGALDFDVVELARLTGQPLLFVGVALAYDLGLVERFKITSDTLINFLRGI